MNEPSDIAKGHNAAGLTNAQVGDGWRLLDDDEFLIQFDCKEPFVCEAWLDEVDQWSPRYSGADSHTPQRTRLSRAELRAARGLPNEPLKPEPESDPQAPAETPERIAYHWQCAAMELDKKCQALRRNLDEAVNFCLCTGCWNKIPKREAQEHINKCPAHPLAAALRERDEARQQLSQLTTIAQKDWQKTCVHHTDNQRALAGCPVCMHRELQEARQQVANLEPSLNTERGLTAIAYEHRNKWRDQAGKHQDQLAEARKRIGELENHGQSCSVCNWTNNGCLNVGKPGEAKWMCHGCLTRRIAERDALKAENEQLRNQFERSGKGWRDRAERLTRENEQLRNALERKANHHQMQCSLSERLTAELDQCKRDLADSLLGQKVAVEELYSCRAELTDTNAQFEKELNHLKEVRARFVMNHLDRICGECGHDQDEDGKCATCLEKELATQREGSEQLAADLAQCKRERDETREMRDKLWTEVKLKRQQLTDKTALCERLNEEFANYLKWYESFLDECDKERREWESKGDMYGVNFHQGRSSGAIDGSIALGQILKLLQRAEGKP